MQRAFAARDLESAQKTPLIAAFAKALFPFFTVVPGIAALIVMPELIKGNYNLTLPLMLMRFYPPGLLGLGLTALMASFMSGMAGNVTAFNTVWTYDLYQTYIAPGRTDRHYLYVGRLTTVIGVAISIGTAYLALHFENMFDYWALLSSIFIATSFATFFLGVFTKWVTSTGAFYGMLAGFATAITHYALYERGIIHYGSVMEMDFYDGTWGFSVNAAVAMLVSLAGSRKPDQELSGLVFWLRDRVAVKHVRGLSPATLAIAVAVLTITLNVIFR
jgi:SSS family solute:Na+ symporter